MGKIIDLVERMKEGGSLLASPEEQAFLDEMDEAIVDDADESMLRAICEKHGVPYEE